MQRIRNDAVEGFAAARRRWPEGGVDPTIVGSDATGLGWETSRRPSSQRYSKEAGGGDGKHVRDWYGYEG